MRKFIICISLMLSQAIGTWGCGPIGPVHNYYMMDVFGHGGQEAFYERLQQYWRNYTGKQAEDYFDPQLTTIYKSAVRKNDRAMAEYIRLTKNYRSVCDAMKDRWNYPTKAELLKMKRQMAEIKRKALAYTHGACLPQYTLLLMRSNMYYAEDVKNLTVWKSRASKLPAGVYRDMCRNIYARALYKTGNRKGAAAIYAQQGDYESLRWCVQNYWKLDGMKKIYAEDPNSPTLDFLVQNFVNSVQENYDNYWEGEIQSYKPHADAFVRFANQVIRENKSKVPALWQEAIAMIHYLQGKPQLALQESERAMQMKGTQMMLDNARCIHLLSYSRCMNRDAKYSDVVTQELAYLDSKIKDNDDDSYFCRVRHRILYQNIVEHYRKAGDQYGALATLGIVLQPKPSVESFYSNYEYEDKVDSLSADQTLAYVDYIKQHNAHMKQGKDDALTRYIMQWYVGKGSVDHYIDANYFADRIGTKYLREGRFAEALKFLEKVPLSYVARQGLAYYMARRSYNRDRWIVGRQVVKERAPWSEEEYVESSLKSNQKVDFCKEMLQLESQYRLAKKETRADIAYQLASRYYQASCYGDCWYLTHYGWSCIDSARSYEKDFAQTALTYLVEARRIYASPEVMNANHQAMRHQIATLYAEAFVRMEIESRVFHFYDENIHVIAEYPAVKPYYTQLLALTRQYSDDTEQYITRCDILKRFATRQ